MAQGTIRCVRDQKQFVLLLEKLKSIWWLRQEGYLMISNSSAPTHNLGGGVLPSRSAQGSAPGGDGGRRGRGDDGKGPPQNGDWWCSRCSFRNFEWRMVCWKCGAPRYEFFAATANDATLMDWEPPLEFQACPATDKSGPKKHQREKPAFGSKSFSSPLPPAALRFDQNSSDQLTELLRELGLEHYSDVFFRNEVDLNMFSSLTEDDLTTMGIHSFGAKRIILNAIQSLRR